MKNSIENVRSNKLALFDFPSLMKKKKKNTSYTWKDSSDVANMKSDQNRKRSLNNMIISMSCAKKFRKIRVVQMQSYQRRRDVHHRRERIDDEYPQFE